MRNEFTVTASESGQRLDIFCVSKLPQFSRAAIQKAIKEGTITVNGETMKPRYAVKESDSVAIVTPPNLPSLEGRNLSPSGEGEPEGVEILYEDKDVVVVDKPAGVEAHPGQVPNQPTVSQWFAERYPQSKDVGEDSTRPGIVHRLDKDTSGVMILAKTQDAYKHLKKMFQHHRAKKEYLALVFGIPNADDGRINQPLIRSTKNPMRRAVARGEALRAKPAITEWKREQRVAGKYALLRVFPLTGRTHQIRVHLHFLGHPIVGDHLYTFKRQKPPAGVARQLLHAEKLTVPLPSGKRKTFTAPLPDDFKAAID